MAAGVFGYLAYDMVRLMEELPPPKPDALGVPDAILIRPRIVAIFDAVKDELTVVTPVRPEAGVSRARGLRPRRRPPDRRGRRARPAARPCPPRPTDIALNGEVVSNTTPAEYKAMVARAKDYIAAGDIFQVVLSQRFEAPFPLPAFALYRALRRVNPSPFLYFLDFDGFRHRRLEPGNPGARARRRGDHPPDRRHAAARRDAGGGQARSARSSSPTRRSAPST